MSKIKYDLEYGAILSAKRIAFEDIFIPEDLEKVMHVKFEPKTGHLHISGISHGMATVTGKLTAAKMVKTSKSVNKTSAKEVSVKAKSK